MIHERDNDVVHTGLSRCLFCGTKLDALGTGNPEMPANPKPGDATVCIKCGSVMILDDELLPRGMTDQEMFDMMRDPAWMAQIARIVRAVRAIHAINASKG